MSEWTADPNEWKKIAPFGNGEIQANGNARRIVDEHGVFNYEMPQVEFPPGLVVANQLNWMIEQGLGYWDQDGEFCTTFENHMDGGI